MVGILIFTKKRLTIVDNTSRITISFKKETSMEQKVYTAKVDKNDLLKY